MNTLQTLAQAVSVAYAAGLNLYATVGIIGLAARFGWIGPLPGALAGITSWWVVGVALLVATIELLARETGNPVIKAEDLYDQRFVTVQAAAFKEDSTS